MSSNFLPEKANQGSGRWASGEWARDSNNCDSCEAIWHGSTYSIEENSSVEDIRRVDASQALDVVTI